VKKTAFAAILVGTGLVTVAHAGSKAVLPLTIDTQQRFALGTVSDARNSADSTSRIECQIGASSAGLGMSCYAADANNNIGVCFSNDPKFAQVAAAIQSDSYIEFHWDESGNCTSLVVAQDSLSGPKLP
jgi:hypothetical protein